MVLAGWPAVVPSRLRPAALAVPSDGVPGPQQRAACLRGGRELCWGLSQAPCAGDRATARAQRVTHPLPIAYLQTLTCTRGLCPQGTSQPGTWAR